MAAQVAELGYTPRLVESSNGSLMPSEADGAATRPPELAVVIGDEGFCSRLRDEGTFTDVPILLSIKPEELNGRVPLAEELLITPFTPAELEARIVRARQQVGGGIEAQAVRVGTLEVDLATYKVSVDGEPVDFAFKEYELLRFLITHPGRVFSREALLNRVWGYDYYGGARTVDVHVRRLRAKLGSEHAARIQTVRGVGYRFDR
jgi:two-component system, OmpR family, alkaline phosphatase synthesis response regulator PhoP